MEDQHGLTQREQLILQAVVHTYITTAEAVGSRALVKRFNLELSPASVRNVMADLEEAGFLEQLHTSSGRVPTKLPWMVIIFSASSAVGIVSSPPKRPRTTSSVRSR